MKIGLFYGSTTCYTEIAAEKIQSEFDKGVVEIFNIKDIPLSQILEFDILILGISTWDYGEIQEDWESHWEEISDLDLSTKIVALYGMGDQIGYTEWFQDALGMLHEQVVNQGAYIIGEWPNKGYEFDKSKALNEDKTKFVGLSLDEDNQYNLSDERIQTWCLQVQNEIQEVLGN